MAEVAEAVVPAERKNFSKIRSFMDLPNLIDVQRRSYERFLQMELLPSEREDNGLQAVFNSVFPINDFRGVSQLDFVDYSIGNWECKCGKLQGLHHLRKPCSACGATRTGCVLRTSASSPETAFRVPACRTALPRWRPI